MPPRLAALALLAVVAWVAPDAGAAEPSLEAAPLPTPFSSARPGGAFPAGWETVLLGERKKPTEYRLVDDAGVTVMHASASQSASGVAQFTVFDIANAPIVEWRWKTTALIAGADNTVAAKEDSPARLVLAFDGDKSKLSVVERAVFFLAKKLAGRELPYAVLEYIWANDTPVGTILENPYTRRVKMVVAASGPGGVGRWHTLRRNVVDDFKRAFGEPPGPLIGVGVLTDADNTGGVAETWYGDIRFLPAPP